MRVPVTCLAFSLVTLSLEGARANDPPSGHVGDVPVGIVVEDISAQEVGNHNIHADDLNYSAGEDYHPTWDRLGSDYTPMDTPYAEHRRTKLELNIWRTKAWTTPSNADVDMDTKNLGTRTVSLSKSSNSGAVYSFTLTQSTLVSLAGSAYVERGKAAIKNYRVSANGEVALELMTTLPGGNNSVSVQQRMEAKSEGSITPIFSFDLGLSVGNGLSLGVPLYGGNSTFYADFSMDDRGINRAEARGTGRPVTGEDETSSFRVYSFASASASATVTKPALWNNFDSTDLWFDQWAKSRYTVRLGPLSQNHGPTSEQGGLPNLQELEAKGMQIGAYPLGRDEH